MITEASLSSLSDFKLSRAILEIRYANSYILWDRAGKIWESVNKKWPTISVVHAEPGITQFMIERKYELSIQLDKASVRAFYPQQNLKEFTQVVVSFYDLLIEILGINEFYRIGFRLIHVKDYDSKESAANALLSNKQLCIPEGRYFNIEGKRLQPEYSVLFEGDSIAAKIILKARDKNIEIIYPAEIEKIDIPPTKPSEKHEVVFDIDYYTLAKIKTGQLNFEEWVKNTYHIIRRDSKFFLK